MVDMQLPQSSFHILDVERTKEIFKIWCQISLLKFVGYKCNFWMKLFTWLKAPWIIIIHFPPPLSVFPGHNLIFHLVYPPTLHLPPHPSSICSLAVFPICDGDRRLITFSRPPSYRQNLKIAAEMSSGAWHGGMRAAGKVFFSLLAPHWRRSQSVWVRTKKLRQREWAGESPGLKVTHRAKFPFACGFPGWSQKKEGISREWQLFRGQTGPMT